MQRGCDSVSTVVEEGKHENTVSIQTFVSWAVPGPFRLPCLAQRDEWPTTCGWHPGKQEHPSLSRLPCGNIPTQVEAFPVAMFCRTTLPKAVGWLPVASLCK
jgi:hypothetical protein